MRLLKDLNKVPYWDTMPTQSVARVLIHFRNGGSLSLSSLFADQDIKYLVARLGLKEER